MTNEKLKSYLENTRGEWVVNKKVDESGDYAFPTYDILSILTYGPELIGSGNQNPFVAELFANSRKMAMEILKLRQEVEDKDKRLGELTGPNSFLRKMTYEETKVYDEGESCPHRDRLLVLSKLARKAIDGEGESYNKMGESEDNLKRIDNFITGLEAANEGGEAWKRRIHKDIEYVLSDLARLRKECETIPKFKEGLTSAVEGFLEIKKIHADESEMRISTLSANATEAWNEANERIDHIRELNIEGIECPPKRV